MLPFATTLQQVALLIRGARWQRPLYSGSLANVINRGYRSSRRERFEPLYCPDRATFQHHMPEFGLPRSCRPRDRGFLVKLLRAFCFVVVLASAMLPVSAANGDAPPLLKRSDWNGF